jgi:hypothetical protein
VAIHFEQGLYGHAQISVASIGRFEVIGPCRAKVLGSLVRSAKLHRNPSIILLRPGLH